VKPLPTSIKEKETPN